MKNYDKQVFELAETFLLGVTTTDNQPVTEEMLQKYYYTKPAETLPDVYFQLLFSAQNASMKPGVIGGSIDNGIKGLAPILCDFDPKSVLEKYGENSLQVFEDIKNTLNPRGKVSSNGLWFKYCETIISGAKFLSRFNSMEDFDKWIDWFSTDQRARLALPLLLKEEIKGFGFALSCDFLKEIGRLEYGKPDTWLRKIFVSLNLCPVKVTDFELLKAIIRVADNSNVTPYKADKVFWLIGSGDFYLDTKKSTPQADDFIELAKKSLRLV